MPSRRWFGQICAVLICCPLLCGCPGNTDQKGVNRGKDRPALPKEDKKAQQDKS